MQCKDATVMLSFAEIEINQPHSPELGNTKGTSESLVQSVRYNGSISENNVEVDEQTFMSVDRTGNKIFWAEPQQLFGAMQVHAR